MTFWRRFATAMIIRADIVQSLNRACRIGGAVKLAQPPALLQPFASIALGGALESPAMGLLIDCYNLLHAEKPPALAGLEAAGLCRRLARSPWAGERIVVVCDGRAHPLGLTESPTGAVELRYSGPHRTADEVIVELIEAETAPRRLTVVSSDRAIQKAGRRRRAQVLSSEEFLHELARPTDRCPPRGAEKPDPNEMPAAEVDRWLVRFGYEPAHPPAPEKQEEADRASQVEPEEDPDVPWPPF